MLLNYEIKKIWEIGEMKNPDTYLSFSLSFTLKFIYMIIIKNIKIKKDKEYEKIESLRSLNN